jgi:glycine oxidase
LVSVRPESADVVVIGGGVIGCAVAWRLAEQGLEVAVIERDVPGRAASWAAAGMLSPLGETRHHPHFLALAQTSRFRYPNFLEELRDVSGLDIEFGAPGKLEVAFDGAELHELGAAFHGMHVRYVGAVEASRIEPEISDQVQGGIWFENDAFVDNRRLGEALWTACVKRKVSFLTGEPALGVRIEGERVAAVMLSSGELTCDKIVITAGAWSAQLQNLPRPLPVFPVRGQMLALRAMPSPLEHMLQSTACYLIPRSAGRILLGATIERAGFDPRTTAVAIQHLLNSAMQLLPPLADASIEEIWTGFRPCTPDQLPILGADPEIEGLFYATGHYRNGILLAPITAELMAALVTGINPPAPLSTFRVDRFSDEQVQAAAT